MRYELICIGLENILVKDNTDGKRKWVAKDEMLDDIFKDPIFDDIQ